MTYHPYISRTETKNITEAFCRDGTITGNVTLTVTDKGYTLDYYGIDIVTGDTANIVKSHNWSSDDRHETVGLVSLRVAKALTDEFYALAGIRRDANGIHHGKIDLVRSIRENAGKVVN